MTYFVNKTFLEVKTVMKKKFLATVLSAVLCLGMATTVFGAQSSSADNSAMTGTTVIGGQTVDVTVNHIVWNSEGIVSREMGSFLQKNNAIWDDSSLTEEEQYKKQDALYSEFFKEKTNLNVTVNGAVGSCDLSLPEGVSIPEGGVKITFPAPWIEKDDTVAVIHMKADGTWEIISDAIAGDGVITGTFTSLSPVLFAAVEPKTAVNGTVSETSSGNGGYSPEYYEQLKADKAAGEAAASSATATSPKTGDSAMPFVIVLAAGALCGAAVVVKRRM